MNFNEIYKELLQTINNAYETGVTVQESEKLAARTLAVRLILSDLIKEKDLDSRMKKHGAKAIRAKVYLEEISKYDKKPTESQLEAVINTNNLVEAAENLFADAETTKNKLESYLDIFKDSHLYFRSIMKGTYEA